MYFIISTERSSTTEYFFFIVLLRLVMELKCTMLTGMLFMNLIHYIYTFLPIRSKTLYLISLAEVT